MEKLARQVSLLLGVSTVVLWASTTQAEPHLTYRLEYVRTYSDDVNWQDVGDKSALLETGLNPAGYDSSWVHQFAVRASVSGLDVTEDVSILAFSFMLDAGLVDMLGWAGSTETYTYDPPESDPPITKPVFVWNPDFELPALEEAIVGHVHRQAAWVTQFGEAGSTYDFVGIAYVRWDPSVLARLVVYPDPPGGSQWGTWLANDGVNATFQAHPDGSVTGDTFTFGAPEPTSAGLLLLAAGVGAVRSRCAKR